MMPVYNKTVPGCDKHRFLFHTGDFESKPDRADSLRITTSVGTGQLVVDSLTGLMNTGLKISQILSKERKT